jgi:hypothetical protein
MENKFEKSMHLVGFIIRIYHDARSSELQVGHHDQIVCGAPPLFHLVGKEAEPEAEHIF